jgi:molybdenum cofactor sulfurtransferase
MEVVKYRILCFLKVDPFSYDLIFVPNVTAAVQFAIGCIQCYAAKEKAISSYYYHEGMCEKLVDLRESCNQYRCFRTDEEVDRWIDQEETTKLEPQSLGLFVYPGQSSVDGRRLPKSW